MTGRRLLRLAARVGPVLALLLLLILPERAAAYDIPYREDYYPECSWWELRGVVGGRRIKRLRVLKQEPEPPANGDNGSN